jgi:N-methylhydantoinase A/oxoprolinase/acetone carboxylase beta subunit
VTAQATYTIGIDTGGTFTDSLVADSTGQLWSVKVPTTPHDLTVCFADAIDQSAAAVGLDREAFLRRTSVIRFSSTIATNTALTHTGPKLGLIVTAGDESGLYGAAEGGAIFQFIPPDMVAGIDERVTEEGQVEREPDSEDVNRIVRGLLERGARILVIGLRNAGANPANERTLLRIVNEAYPRHYLGAVPALLSTHVSASADDAGRTGAAVVNAYMHKRLATSLYKAEDDLRRSGFGRPLLVVTADGTVNRVAKTRALFTYQSGPAAGVHASALLSRVYGIDTAVTADVGGTSTDLSVVIGARPVRRRRIDIGGLEVAQSSVELHSIALGGGSICSVREGAVVVGPESAAGAPGPASFGLGGRDATPTDAWLVLGYLDPNYYLGGRRKLDPELAKEAIDERIAGPVGVSVEEAALAIKEAAETAVAEAVQSLAGGAVDLRQAALIAYGGGGGILLPSVAKRAGIPRTFLSSLSPVFSAFGVSTFDVRHRYEGRALLNGDPELRETIDPLLAAARRDIRGEGFEPDAARVEASLLTETGETLVEEVALTEFGERVAEMDIQTGTRVVVSLSATCEVAKPGLPADEIDAGSDLSEAESGRREVVLPGGRATVPVYARERLGAGHVVLGPALIESAGSTYLIPPDTECAIDRAGTAVVT